MTRYTKNYIESYYNSKRKSLHRIGVKQLFR